MYSGLSEMLSINTSQLVLIWDQFALEKVMTNIKSTEPCVCPFDCHNLFSLVKWHLHFLTINLLVYFFHLQLALFFVFSTQRLYEKKKNVFFLSFFFLSFFLSFFSSFFLLLSFFFIFEFWVEFFCCGCL